MKISLWLSTLFLIAINPISVFGQQPSGMLAASDIHLTEPDGRRLRTIIEEDYTDNNIIIGGTTGSWAFGTNTGVIMDREFSYVTPENDFKQVRIHPDNDTWNWALPNSWIDHITENGQSLRSAGAIGPQCSDWAYDDSRTAAELDTNLNEFMLAIFDTYSGIPGFYAWDVVNETVINGEWFTNRTGIPSWENPWYLIGLDDDPNGTPLYIRMAFEIATEHATDLKLIYNHHEDPGNSPSWNRIKQTILYLRDLGLRVDGIGWQAHVINGWASEENLNALRELIDWAHVNDLEFHITEASVWIDVEPTEEVLELQGETYASILQVLIEKRFNGSVGWNIWHIDDGHGWQSDRYPSLFDASYLPKPAYYAIQEVLENGTVDIKGQDNYPETIQLISNFPNPFNPSTTISYSLPEQILSRLVVYDIRGQKVTTLQDGVISPGHYEVQWSGINHAGMPVSTGVYFCRLEAGDYSKTIKILYLK